MGAAFAFACVIAGLGVMLRMVLRGRHPFEMRFVGAYIFACVGALSVFTAGFLLEEISGFEQMIAGGAFLLANILGVSAFQAVSRRDQVGDLAH